MTDPKKPSEDVKGEGNYTATRNFDRAQEGFVKKNKDKVPEMGQKAAQALNSDEGKELRAAEERVKRHSKTKEER